MNAAATRQESKTLQLEQIKVTRENVDLFARLAKALDIPIEEDLGAIADSLAKREERAQKK